MLQNMLLKQIQIEQMQFAPSAFFNQRWEISSKAALRQACVRLQFKFKERQQLMALFKFAYLDVFLQ
jgi:hypothetical protein